MEPVILAVADISSPAHPLNWAVGWWLILAGFLSGAGLGLFFHRAGFMGGYDSFRRRLARLGHIACAALGILNLIYALAPWPTGGAGMAASWALVAGGVMMPTVCFLTAWREPFRHLFFLPVLALTLGVAIAALIGGG